MCGGSRASIGAGSGLTVLGNRLLQGRTRGGRRLDERVAGTVIAAVSPVTCSNAPEVVAGDQ
jgi:hypothetical protein